MKKKEKLGDSYSDLDFVPTWLCISWQVTQPLWILTGQSMEEVPPGFKGCPLY
jgi:hypothetical protein